MFRRNRMLNKGQVHDVAPDGEAVWDIPAYSVVLR
jgi:hypothetical protein